MWRSFFLAMGISLCIIGSECLLVDKFVIASKPQPAPTSNSLFRFSFRETITERPREWIPPEWAPWGLVSAGAVIIIYSFTIPQRYRGGGE